MKKKILILITAIAIMLCITSCGIMSDIEEYGDYYDSIEDTQIETNGSLSSDNIMRVRFIDVEQGDSALIIFPEGKSMLIDTGEYYAEEAVAAAINSEGLTHIDAIVATHPHSDHMGSMAAIIEQFDFTDIYMPNATSNSKSFEKLLDSIEENDLNAIETKAGMTIDMDSNVKIDVLAPVSDEYENTNNYSIVLRMTYGDITYLFMGDAETLVEKEILASGTDISADILKLGHHGSSTSSSKEFIEAVDPSIVIASCGKDNSYGHPHDEVVELMEDMNITMLRTYETGDIIIETDGKNIALSEDVTIEEIPHNTETDISHDPQPTEESENDNDGTLASTDNVYVSKSGKYHRIDCQHYSNSFTKMTKEEAQAAGYAACKSCDP